MSTYNHPAKTLYTAGRQWNGNKHTIINLGCCTPSQLISEAEISRDGTVCIIGNPSRGIGIAKAMLRRSQKPFLFMGTAIDKESAFSTLNPEWSLDCAQMSLPVGNGALYFSKPSSAYVDMCEYMEDWSRNYFPIFHLGKGLQIGTEILNLLGSAGQCLLFCDSIPQCIRGSDSQIMSSLTFMRQMNHLIFFDFGGAASDIIELLPTYQGERITVTTGFNTFRSRPIFHPLRVHRGHGISVGESKTEEYKKSIIEMDDLKAFFDEGYALSFAPKTNDVFLAMIV